MTRTLSSNSRFQQFIAGAALAAAAAAIFNAVGAPVAGADTIDELLMQSEGDFTQAGSLYSGIDPSLLSAHDAAEQAHVVSGLDGQAGLISTLQAHQDALPETVQTSSQIIGADQQLATASNDLLTATTNLTNAADAGDYATGQAATLSGEITGYFDRLDFAYTELFQALPAELNAEFTTEFATSPNLIDPVAPVVTDVATSASAASDVTTNVVPPIVTSYPFALLNEAAANLTDANQVLASVPAGDTVDFLTPQLGLQADGLQVISNLDAAQSTIDAYDNGVLTDLATPFFNSMDQGFASATEAILNADQALDSALVNGTSAIAAELTVSAADLGLTGDAAGSLGTDLLSLLF